MKAAGRVVALVALLAAAPRAAQTAQTAQTAHEGSDNGLYAAVTPGREMVFPADHGSHPDFRTEWWYVTGWLTTDGGESLGFQITFFRTKPNIDGANPSEFTPHQLLIAHCALSDPKRGRLWQDQRIRRAGFGLAEAATGDTHVWIDDWSLERRSGIYRATLAAEGFALELALTATQPAMLHGASGLSRKGPAPESASYYYSLPHLTVSGSIARDGAASRVTGEAWFDHEWSSQYLDAEATGWDWIGINLRDGSALMAFRIRDRNGAARWAGGSLRGSDGKMTVLANNEVRFAPTVAWTSPRTGIRYPVAWRVDVGSRQFDLEPLMNDQENDTRLSTGAIYWEGAVSAYENSQLAGRGYLELTGYGEKLDLR